MSDHDLDRYEEPTPQEQADADRLDAEITAMLSGSAHPTADRQLWWVAGAGRVDPSSTTLAAVAARVERTAARRWVWARVAAALLGGLLIIHGLGNLIAGEWISQGLGEPHGEHVMIEGGLAFLAAGAAVAAAALRRRFLPIAVFIGAPLGAYLGFHGIHEVDVFAWGAALHLAEGVAAIAIVVTFLIGWRYSRRSHRE